MASFEHRSSLGRIVAAAALSSAVLVTGLVGTAAADVTTSTAPVFVTTAPGHVQLPEAYLSAAPGVTNPTPTGLPPATVNGFYHLHAGGKGQVIMIIAAYHHPAAASDLARFSTTYHLPQLGSCNPNIPLSQQSCFSIAEPDGPPPSFINNWSLEVAADDEWAHAEAPLASIVLVEALDDNETPPTHLLDAVKWADSHGATEVSMSFGSPDSLHPATADRYFQQPGVLYTASAGDSGHQANWPADSPFAIGIGGTSFKGCSGTTCNSITETAWSDSGGAAATNNLLPAFQKDYMGPVAGAATISALAKEHRGIPDVGFLADPLTGVSVYDSDSIPPDGSSGWQTFGGTSLGAPAWAGILASGAAAGSKALQGADAMYRFGWEHHLRNVSTGSNGSCGVPCTAGPGYDLITGLGTPYAYG
jgi:subtilase family serine protease